MLKTLPLDSRPREKLLARGAASLSDSDLVALLLRTGTRARRVLEMGEEVLQAFGGLAGLLETAPDRLKRVSGLGGTAKRAELLAVMELARRASSQQLRQREVFSSPDAVKHYVQLRIAQKEHEVFAVLFLDAQHRLIEMRELFQGTLTQASVYPREVVKQALALHAASVVLAHNHPSGTAYPSRSDEALTQTLKAALALIDVRVLDHVIVAPGDALSMAEKGLL
jgi:DNA repair protein RadC